MAAYVKYDTFIEDVFNKLHDLFGTQDTVYAALCSDAPVTTTDTTIADRTQVANGGGYTTNGIDTQNDGTRTGSTFTATAVDAVWTATTGFGPFRYVALWNDTSVTDRLICDFDYGSNVTLLASETFTVDFGASWFTAT